MTHQAISALKLKLNLIGIRYRYVRLSSIKLLGLFLHGYFVISEEREREREREREIGDDSVCACERVRECM